jgi:carbamoyltransferase
MRELEDEGKVMALASFGYPIPDDQNPLLSLFSVEGLKIKAKYHGVGLYKKLQRIHYLFPSEQFAFMAQRVLEVCITKLVENAQASTGLRHLVYAGGVASNIKVNMLLKNSGKLDDVHIFPHMGDGGLALGAALYANLKIKNISKVKLDNLFFGPSYSVAEIKNEIGKFKVHSQRFESIEDKAAQLISSGHIILWFQGRMEYGPRALGNRSILALPNSVAIKNKLNIYLKKRVWYQPFCPSMLEEDAAEILEDHNGVNNRFMTMGYKSKEKYANAMVAVTNADNSCRPQILSVSEGPEFARYTNLLKKLKELTGFGIVLNTSFNKHGESIITTPKEALELLVNSQFPYLVMEDYLVWKDQSI